MAGQAVVGIASAVICCVAAACSQDLDQPPVPPVGDGAGSYADLSPRRSDNPVSSPLDGGQDLGVRLQAQTETSMVRVDLPPDMGPAVFLVVYNDESDVVGGPDSRDGGSPWTFVGTKSLAGWADSSDGIHWTRHSQLEPPVGASDGGIQVDHGDPWLASWASHDSQHPSVAFYVTVGQHGPGILEGPWYLVLSRWASSGPDARTFTTPVQFAASSSLMDGPKIAITGDGTAGLVVWKNTGPPGAVGFKRIDQPADSNWSFPSDSEIGNIQPGNYPAPRDGGCINPTVTHHHPRVAAGFRTIYVAMDVMRSCTPSHQNFTEVYRTDSQRLQHPDAGAPFERILIVEAPEGIASVDNTVNTVLGESGVSQGGPLPSMAVVQGRQDGGTSAESEIVLIANVALHQVVDGGVPDGGEKSREDVVTLRIMRADLCNADPTALDRCHDRAADSKYAPIGPAAMGMQTVTSDIASRVGLWAAQPALFSGKVPDGTVDTRVGMLWYAQPLRGIQGLDELYQRRTVVEAIVSGNAGDQFQGPFNLNSKGNGPGPNWFEGIGDWFSPCNLYGTMYFGDYISGTFNSPDPLSNSVLGAWGDSREGCIEVVRPFLHHLHVWSGYMGFR